jgi:hypothetical protein
MSTKVTFRCVSEDGETRMMLVYCESEMKIISRQLDDSSDEDFKRVRAELTNYAIDHGFEVI